jgi:3-phenylpropionate/cinnamic acid dioxygenase small subunit
MLEVETAVETEVATKGRRVRATEEAFLLIQEFLTDEADLLDHDQHLEWVEMLTDDIQYRMPIRETRYRFDGNGFIENGDTYFNDNRSTLGLKARHNVEFKYAYERDPAPRVRRLVTNLRVHEGDNPDEYIVKSYILMTKNRFDKPTYDILTAERVDIIRQMPDGMKLARRDIFVDMEVLSTYTWDNVFL